MTSQKDQALKVLRDKIPPQLRQLCVLLAGGSKDAAKELEQGLDALSAAVATPGQADLRQRIDALTTQRRELRARSALLNRQIQQLREEEHGMFGPLVPGHDPLKYRGTLGEIVRKIKQGVPRHGWMPAVDPVGPDLPPLSSAEVAELLKLLRDNPSGRPRRQGQHIPEPNELPSPADLMNSVQAEQQAQGATEATADQMTQQLGVAGVEALEAIRPVAVTVQKIVDRLDLGGLRNRHENRDWLQQCVDQHLAGRHGGLWGHLAEVRGEAGKLQQALRSRGVGSVVELRRPLSELGVGTGRGMLTVGRELRDYLASGGKLRKLMPSNQQKRAASLLELVSVDGQPPATAANLDAALELLEAEIATTQLVRKWADAGVEIPAGSLTFRLSELHDADGLLGDILELLSARDVIADTLARNGVRTDLSSLGRLVRASSAVPGALAYVALRQARMRVNELYSAVRAWSATDVPCPELAFLSEAIADRNLEAYREGLAALNRARAERDADVRCAQLAERLHQGHPALAQLVFECHAAEAGRSASPKSNPLGRGRRPASSWSNGVPSSESAN